MPSMVRAAGSGVAAALGVDRNPWEPVRSSYIPTMLPASTPKAAVPVVASGQRRVGGSVEQPLAAVAADEAVS